MNLADLNSEYSSLFDSGKLPFIECTSCLHRFYYVRANCPKCSSGKIVVRASEGFGRIFSLTWIYRKNPVQKDSYAIIEMDEGFRLYSSLIDSDHAEIEDRVSLIMLERNGRKIPFFKLRT